MDSSPLTTEFAPPERSPRGEINREFLLIKGDFIIPQLLGLIPIVFMVLNRNRQIIYVSRYLLKELEVKDEELVFGLRVGELLGCKHASKNSGGCGTTAYCRFCGVTLSILKTQEGESRTEECRILVKSGDVEEALDLRVWTTPFKVDGETCTLFSLANIADEKEKAFLERLFLHDILNTASSLRGFAEFVTENSFDTEAKGEFLKQISYLSNRIIEEINAHRQLLAAENNELEINWKALDSLNLLTGLFRSYNAPEILNDRHIVLSDSPSVQFHSDETLLTRVIGNMIKNAVEASVPGETVKMGCFLKDNRVHFWVHNPTCIPENIRLQIFNRSFSTKGTGRGLGTYSMKYLTEKYLKGQVCFVTSEKEGTTFTASYPLHRG